MPHIHNDKKTFESPQIIESIIIPTNVNMIEKIVTLN